jgi:hypothetical protein
MLAAPERQTKDITLLSGVHGRDRIAERKISKHDLQAAILLKIPKGNPFPNHGLQFYILLFTSRV